MSEPEHVHKWVLQIHMDGCHQYVNQYHCECGAYRVFTAERQFYNQKRPTMSVVWALDDCERCQALLNGKRRRNKMDTTIMPDGTEIPNYTRSHR